MSFLEKVLHKKREELLVSLQQVGSFEMRRLAEQCMEGKERFVMTKILQDKRICILEVKPKSPTKGVLIENVDDVLMMYAKSDADFVSVLTDKEFFGGGVELFARAKEKLGKPLLRKDFIIDLYQVDESAAMGASAVLLIVAALSHELLKELLARCVELGLDALVEAHTEAEVVHAVEAGASIIGINNRDLGTLQIDLGTTERLVKLVPADRFVISESGIGSAEDIDRVMRAGASGILVGTGVLSSADSWRTAQGFCDRVHSFPLKNNNQNI